LIDRIITLNQMETRDK